MGENARKAVENDYRWSDILPKYEKLWDNLYKQSVAYSEEIPIKENPFLNDYLNTFSHYPTSIINMENMCAITKEGKDALKTGQLPVPYANIGSLLNNNAIIEILKHLSKNPCRINDIVSIGSLSIKENELIFTLLWMAKYSLIHITCIY